MARRNRAKQKLPGSMETSSGLYPKMPTSQTQAHELKLCQWFSSRPTFFAQNTRNTKIRIHFVRVFFCVAAADTYSLLCPQ